MGASDGHCSIGGPASGGRMSGIGSSGEQGRGGGVDGAGGRCGSDGGTGGSMSVGRSGSCWSAVDLSSAPSEETCKGASSLDACDDAAAEVMDGLGLAHVQAPGSSGSDGAARWRPAS